MMKLSIVIPVYNVANWIDDCIRSCMNQDMALKNEYEIIVVNDGSLDDTMSHLKAYGNDIVIVDQPNSGVSVARNNGLQHATGEYVWYIDGDDYIEPNVLGGLYQYIKRNKLDVLNIAFNSVPDMTVYPAPISNTSKSETIEFKPVLQGTINQMVACNTLSRLEYIKSHNILFKEGMWYGEDTLWAFWMLLFEPKREVIYNKVYNYRVRQGSAMHSHSEVTNKRWLDSMLLMHETYIDALVNYSNEISDKQKTNLMARINWSSSNLLFGALRLGKVKRIEILHYLELKGHYPYPILWNKITYKNGLNNLLLSFLTLFFPCKLYYTVVGWIYDKLKKV
ncbi:glycosyltransferase family 2 protein [Parabacteroides faecis]|uniref:glycosyltransferase family 2 protein n=1 Tax=Parabacteroides faecis TaxID=1217282 RepID=UPI002164C4BA|nr:glycosyltransferase family 2 protein [Parabacteroides faecis]MCS2893473.1 glycosyltransferase family 2 protein [Parabacteroides faecis]UVQ47929.1 glycosyltransferase family 2 protein [Parabacteroides faecis]